MVKNQSTGYGTGQAQIFLAPKPLSFNRAPATTDVNYDIGQLWLFNGTVYCLSRVVAGTADWEILGGSSSDVSTLTGNSGGAINPTNGNINILGSGTTTVSGSGSTLTISATAAGYPISPYVVGPVGLAGYQTIQSALDAANAVGGGTVYVQPGSYTENLTLYNNTEITGAVAYENAGNIVLTGVHIPPATGTFSFSNLQLASATHIFSSAVAGSASLAILACTFNLTNGFIFNLPNWTGSFNINDCGELSTNNGVLNNAGGATFFSNNCQIGAGTGQTFVSNGNCRFDLTFLDCPCTISGGTIFTNFALFANTLVISGNATGTIFLADCFPVSGPAITMSSTGAVSVFQSTISTANNPAIDGAGAGVLTLGDILFMDNADIAATLTVDLTTDLMAGTFDTGVTAAKLLMSGTTLAAAGSNANIGINLTPKGTGSVVYSASRAGSDLNYQATNSDNTNGASTAGFQSAVGGATAGDPYIQFDVSGVQSWKVGIDNSASDTFVIAASNALGTSNAASWSVAGDLTNSGAITSTSGNITAASGLLVTTGVGSGVSFPVGTASGSSPQIIDARVGSVTFTGISIAAAADLTLTLTNSTITGASTRVMLTMSGSTTGSAPSIKSITPSAGSLAIVVTNGTGATTTTADITFDFVVLN